jgi:hypothetical protein
VETIFPAFGFGDVVLRLVVITLAIGFFPALIFAWIFELTDDGLVRDKDIDRNQPGPPSKGRKLDFIIIGLLILAVSYFTFDKFVLDPRRDALEMTNAIEGLAEVSDLMNKGQKAEAFSRARQLAPDFRDEGLLEELWATVSETVNLASDPPNAHVWMRPYSSSEEDWQYLGRTPLEGVHMPQVRRRLRMELEGHHTIYVVNLGDRMYQLDPVDSIPEGMVRVLGGDFDVFMPGLEHLAMNLSDYLIDTTEVTNRQFKQFIDAGGYNNSEYWHNKFLVNGHEISFEEAVQKFQDQSGRTGPSTWSVGMYPEGLADHPVGGVSWYEAAAYAKFVGKQLPSLYHWYWAALPSVRDFVLPYSNFNGRGTVEVGTLNGISRSGALDMAGNVREWAGNRIGEERFLLGGGWSDPEYMYVDVLSQPPFDRNTVNGFRLISILDEENLENAYGPIVRPIRNYELEQPVTDEIFDVYRRQYAYDATPLNIDIVSSKENEGWIVEEIELDAAYGGERLTVFLYIPIGVKAPYRPVVYFPGSNAIYRRDNPSDGKFVGSFLIKSGRAVLFPVYKGTYSRASSLNSDIQNKTIDYREHVIQWSKDLGRSLDYLETRSDIKMDQLIYVGVSWGGAMAPVMIAMEPRIKASVLISGGLVLQPTQPEVDPFNFLPRVRVPTLMINTPNDYFYPLYKSQKPFFRFLGAANKESILLEGSHGHIPPINLVALETLDWLDRYQAPRQ